MFKKINYFFILIGLLLMIVSCKQQNIKLAGEKSIVTSFFPIYVFTLNITKDVNGISVINMTQPQTGCLHDYQLTPKDLITLEKADYFIINGAGMESFLDKVVKDLPKLTIIDASQGIDLIKDDQGVSNPHVWVAISGAIREVQNINDRLCSVDPEHASLYQKNTEEYLAKLTALKDKMHQELEPYQNTNIITFHEAFPYFAKEFNLKTAAVIEREPGSEPTPAELINTIRIIKKNGVKALFTEPQYPAKVAETIAAETHTNIYVLDPVVTFGEASDINAIRDSYINLMEQNLQTLKKALQ